MSPRNMTRHMLTPLRHFYQGNHLIGHAAMDATEEQYQEYGRHPSGRCMHLVPGQTECGNLPLARLGCEGNNKIPVFLFRDSDSYSGAGFAGPDPAVENGPAWSTGINSVGRHLVFIGLEGFELATTEFDKTAGPYHVGDYLRAPEFDSGAQDKYENARTVAGILTKGDTPYGASTIVGIVSSSAPNDVDTKQTPDENPYGERALSFYTTYRPPVQGLLDGTPVDVGA